MEKYLKKYSKRERFKYIYRIDDISPFILWDKFYILMELFKEYRVVPLLGLIPDNKDESLKFEEENPIYWELIKEMVDKKEIEICQHGYQHRYSTTQNSINQKFYGRVSSSEFAKIPYEIQKNNIKKGNDILKSHGLYTDIWMAPSHTNDSNTYKALKKLGFKYITDGIGVYPFERYGLKFIPQQLWGPKREFFFGVFTICIHLDDLTDDLLEDIKEHLKSGDQFISFSDATKIETRFYHSILNIVYKLKRIGYYHIVRRYRFLRKTNTDLSKETREYR